jgi:isopenicillin-N epimerase
MSITRRQFLTRSGLSLAAGALTSSPAISEFDEHYLVADKQDMWASVREQFNLSPEYIHLCAVFFIVSHPRSVREAIRKYRSAIDENPFLFVEQHLFGPQELNLTYKVKKSVAEYVEGRPEEIALTGSTTMGLALIYNGLPLKEGQEILTTVHDFYPHHEAIRLAAERTGASVRKIRLFDDFKEISEEMLVARVRNALRPRTRAVGITWVHSSTGLKLPVRAIAEVIKEANSDRDEADRIFLIVDGVHGFGVERDAVAKLGCDFFCSGTHKWILAPRGTGIIWGDEASWAHLRPTIPSFTAPEVFNAWQEEHPPDGPTQAAWVSPGGFHAFEHQWAMTEAFQFHQQIGRKRIAERVYALCDQFKKGLAEMAHIKLYTPQGSRLAAGLVCFDVAGMAPKEVVKKLLERKIIASTTPYQPTYVRIGPSLINTPQEIDAVLHEIRAMA